MNLFDRFLTALYALAVTVFLLLFVAETAGLSLPGSLYDNISLSKTELLCAVGVFILVGLRLVWASIRGSGQEKQDGRYLVLSEGVLGQVKVSVQAVENLVVKVAMDMNGVKEVKPRISSSDKGVSVTILATVSPDISIPDTTKLMQDLVKERVFGVAGIALVNVQISIETIVVNKPRIE